MGLVRMLGLLAKTSKATDIGWGGYFSHLAEQSFTPQTRAAATAFAKKHTAPYRNVSTPGEIADAFLFRGRKPRADSSRGMYKELSKRVDESPTQTAQRMFGTRFDDVIGEQTAAQKAMAQAQGAQPRLDAAELTKRTRMEGAETLGASPKFQEYTRNQWSAAQVTKLEGQASVEAATAAFHGKRAGVTGTLTKAINEADATGGGRPFMGIPNWILNHPKTIMGVAAVPYALNAADTATGYAVGGPGYGGAIGWGEGQLGGRNNVFQGANVNMNFQAQSMAFNELTSSAVLPQGSAGTAPMMSRKMGRQFQNSAQGLTLGLHKGRHGGY